MDRQTDRSQTDDGWVDDRQVRVFSRWVGGMVEHICFSHCPPARPLVSFQCMVYHLILKRPHRSPTAPPAGTAPAHSWISHVILAFRTRRGYMWIVLSRRIAVIRSRGPRALTEAWPPTLARPPTGRLPSRVTQFARHRAGTATGSGHLRLC